MIPIICGDPHEDPPAAASYTRFILPFAYCPQPCSEQDHPVVYEEITSPPSLERKNYLTVETAAVLFERTKSFHLTGVEYPVSFPFFHNQNRMDVYIRAPQLLLFEWPKNLNQGNEREEKSLLHTGFLIVETSFRIRERPPDLDSLLAFNEIFRYWQRPYVGHEEDRNGSPGYREKLARFSVDLREPEKTVGEGTEQVIYFERWASLLDIPARSDGKLWRLFPQQWADEARAWVQGDPQRHDHPWESGWIRYSDNRTFVWTCAIIEGGGNALRESFSPPEDDGAPSGDAASFGHWIKLLNVDVPKNTPEETHGSRQFERQWARKRTYHRWEELGTFYGFNFHSGAMLGPPAKEPPLWKHFGDMYFDQTMLLLYLRVCSFRFSRRLSRISAKAQDSGASNSFHRDKSFEVWQEEFRALRWSFNLFTNLYEFPLLSNQQQSVEMYALAREYMDVEELFREVQKEIQSSHDYVAIRTDQEQTTMATILTVVAAGGAAIGLAMTMWGMTIPTALPPLETEGVKKLALFILSCIPFFFLIFLVIVKWKNLSRYLRRLLKADEQLSR